MRTHKNAKTPPHGRAVMVRRIEGEGWTAAEIAARLRLARSTVAAHPAAAGLGRPNRLEPAAPVRGYQRQRPGELLPLAIKKPARFRKTGHRITGNRRNASDGAGWELVHVAVDDATRLAHVEVPADERRQSCTGFLVRAPRWLEQRGIRVERVMSDDGSGYVSRLFAKVRRLLRIRHLRTRPYTPKTNGKAGRFIQTLPRGWAYALPHRSADGRAADLPRWLAWYDTDRPHAGLAGRAPAAMLPTAT